MPPRRGLSLTPCRVHTQSGCGCRLSNGGKDRNREVYHRGRKVRANPKTQNPRAVPAQASRAPSGCPLLYPCDAVEPTQGP